MLPHPFKGNGDRLDQTLFIELHALDASDAVVGLAITERTAVIDDKPLVPSR
jgi:hypothetical protein